MTKIKGSFDIADTLMQKRIAELCKKYHSRAWVDYDGTFTRDVIMKESELKDLLAYILDYYSER